MTTMFLAAVSLSAGEHPQEHPKEHPTAAPAVPAVTTPQEHPKEHPTAAPAVPAATTEQPKGTKYPAEHERTVESQAWKKQIRGRFNTAVVAHVSDNSKEGGFHVHDVKLNKDWMLKLVGVHRNKIVHLGGQRFFACADFKTVAKAKKDKLDLDFYASKTETGWQIDKVLIHKVNGKPRYTYNEKNERDFLE